MSSIHEVARLAQVSTATVSRVLNGSAAVSGPVEERVLRAVEALNYRPNKFARGLAGNLSDCIGVIVPELTNPFFGTLVQGIEEAVRAHGLQLTVATGNRSAEQERRATQWLGSHSCDVQILWTTAMSNAELLEQAGRVPSVILGRLVPELAQRCVYLDDRVGSQLATRHLLSLGHTRIAHVAFAPYREQDWVARSAGYRRALEEAGLPVLPELMIEAGGFDEESGRRATETLLDRGEPFTAIFAGNDQIAAGVLLALRRRGLRIPEDVSVVGFDDVPVARFLYPPLTTIHQPVVAMAQAAVDLALASTSGHAPREVTHKFTPSLVVRESVGAGPGRAVTPAQVPAAPPVKRRRRV